MSSDALYTSCDAKDFFAGTIPSPVLSAGLLKLSAEWRTLVEKRLSTGTVENWNGKLHRTRIEKEPAELRISGAKQPRETCGRNADLRGSETYGIVTTL